jgi:transposase
MRRTRKGSGAPEGARRATGGAPERPERGRFSVRRKAEAVLRLLRGEDLDTVSRELGVTPATLSFWREAFLGGGEGSLKSRPTDGRVEEIRRLKAKIGELAMEKELLEEKIDRLENHRPLSRRRSRR